MVSMKKWIFGAAVLAGALSLGATSAQAAQFRVYVGGPVAYAPPSPGPGYFWTAGYYSGGYWVPGRWDFRGNFDRDHFVGYAGHFDRDRDHDRGSDRGWDRGRDHGRR
jgi:hypothetical protein